MTEVLVIGAGRRVIGAVLPALGCLADRFRIAAVCSRSEKRIAIAGREEITTRTSLDGVDFSRIGLIAMAPTLASVPRLLERLSREDVGRAALLLDTPVLPPTRLAAARFFPAFKRVLVAEDTLALPPFIVARRLIDAGAIGTLRRIYFFHNGYKYHALASLKLLAGRSPLRRIVSRRYPGKVRRKELLFDSGVSAVLCEPRDYRAGKFLLQGDRGSIADYDYPVSPVQRIGYRLEGQIYRGLTLNGEPVPAAGLDQAYLAGVGTDVLDASPMNTMKLRGLMDLLVSSLEERSPHHYRPAEAICDNLAYIMADRLGIAPGPHLLERGLLRFMPPGIEAERSALADN